MKALRLLTAVLCLSAPLLTAQAMPEPTFYKLDFVVKEVDAGKVINSRSYSSIQSASGKERSSIRTGNRVPLPSAPVNYQFSEVGINIDFGVLRELPADRVAVELTVEISSNIPSETPGTPPIYRTNKWQSHVMVPIRKPTTVFTSDDPSSKRQFQVDVTATPLK